MTEKHRPQKKYQWRKRRENLPSLMCMNAKSRAKKFHLEFDLSPGDILIPEYCPILGIKLEVADGKQGPSSPSLDRIDSLRGYVRGNTRVISWRANKLKSDATPDELHAFAQFYYKTNLTELDF